ncbi:hypothetical protein MASR2M117_07110 [Paludibacter sp.]
MKIISKILLIFFLLSFTFSCKKEIEFNGEISEPLLVVNSIINPDSTINVNVSKSKFFLSNKTGFDVIKNADVYMYINNSTGIKLTHKGEGNYSSTTKSQIGDTVRLEVNAQGLNSVESKTIVPEIANILSCDTSFKILRNEPYIVYLETNPGKDGVLDTVANTQYGELKIIIKLNDPQNIKNYYRITLKKDTEITAEGRDITQTYYVGFVLEGFSEPGTDNLMGTITNDNLNTKTQQLISDDIFNGKEISLVLKTETEKIVAKANREDFFNNMDYRVKSVSYTLNFQSVTKEMYLYLKTIESSQNIFFEAFTEPVQIYNNITNGIGIFGSYTNNTVKIKLF